MRYTVELYTPVSIMGIRYVPYDILRFGDRVFRILLCVHRDDETLYKLQDKKLLAEHIRDCEIELTVPISSRIYTNVFQPRLQFDDNVKIGHPNDRLIKIWMTVDFDMDIII